MIELQTEEPQKNRVNKWRLYWFHESDPDAAYPANAETLAKAGYLPAVSDEGKTAPTLYIKHHAPDAVTEYRQAPIEAIVAAGFTPNVEAARVLNELREAHIRELSALRAQLTDTAGHARRLEEELKDEKRLRLADAETIEGMGKSLKLSGQQRDGAMASRDAWQAKAERLGDKLKDERDVLTEEKTRPLLELAEYFDEMAQQSFPTIQAYEHAAEMCRSSIEELIKREQQSTPAAVESAKVIDGDLSSGFLMSPRLTRHDRETRPGSEGNSPQVSEGGEAGEGPRNITVGLPGPGGTRSGPDGTIGGGSGAEGAAERVAAPSGTKCPYCNRAPCLAQQHRDDPVQLRICRHATRLERDFLVKRVGRVEGELEYYRDKKREADQALASSIDDVRQLQEQLRDLTAANARQAEVIRERESEREALRNIINIDRTGLAAALNHVKAIVKGYLWIADGHWGSYDYTQHTTETLQKEVGWLIGGVCGAADRALRASGDRADAALRSKPSPTSEAPSSADGSLIQDKGPISEAKDSSQTTSAVTVGESAPSSGVAPVVETTVQLSPPPGVPVAAADSGAEKPRETADTVFAATDNPGGGAGATSATCLHPLANPMLNVAMAARAFAVARRENESDRIHRRPTLVRLGEVNRKADALCDAVDALFDHSKDSSPSGQKADTNEQRIDHDRGAATIGSEARNDPTGPRCV